MSMPIKRIHKPIKGDHERKFIFRHALLSYCSQQSVNQS